MPLVVVALFSFNSSPSLQNFTGFSLQWYEEFFGNQTLRDGLFASLEIATVTMIFGTAIGTALAFGLVRAQSKLASSSNVLMLSRWSRRRSSPASRRCFFSQIGMELSVATVMIAHITFSISFVTVIVRARLSALNRHVEEAALDLGATRLHTVRLVVLPALWPAIIASGLLIFALSFDDFVLSFFTTGESPTPLPVQIYSSIRFGVTPTINAIGTMMLFISFVLIIIAVALPRLLGRKGEENVLVGGDVG